uniref:Transposase n=1 Tax=Globodera rostochiensis TaxID=31243 RepID=A0A914HP19_GLORO
MSITKSTDRTPKLDKLNPIQVIRIHLSQKKFDQKKAELTRAGFKNSYSNQIDETVAKELGTTYRTIYTWKSELGQSKPQPKHSHSEQKKLMKRYYEIKDKKPKICDEDIAKRLKIGRRTLSNWKKQFKQQQFHPNSVDGHSVEQNAAANVQV